MTFFETDFDKKTPFFETDFDKNTFFETGFDKKTTSFETDFVIGQFQNSQKKNKTIRHKVYLTSDTSYITLSTI